MSRTLKEETFSVIPSFDESSNMVPITITVTVMPKGYLTKIHTSEAYPFDNNKRWETVVEINEQAVYSLLNINQFQSTNIDNAIINKGVVPYATNLSHIFAIYKHDWRWYIIKQPIENPVT